MFFCVTEISAGFFFGVILSFCGKHMDIISLEFLGNYHLYRFNTLTVRRRMKRRGKNDMHHLNIGGFPIMLHRQGMYCRINPFQMLIP